MVVFSISMAKKQISPLLAHPWKKFWQNPLLAPPPGKNPSDAHGRYYIEAKKLCTLI